MNLPRILSGVLLLSFASFMCTAGAAQPVAQSAAAAAGVQQSDYNRKIYAFEHRLLPHWVYNTGNSFFRALLAGDDSVLKQQASEVVDPAFARALQIRTIVPDKAVLITFAAPVESPQCYAAIVAKTDNGYIYYTLEKAIDLDGGGKVKAMFCAWTSPKTRANYGARSYDTDEAFVKEFLAGAPTEVQAGLRLAD